MSSKIEKITFLLRVAPCLENQRTKLCGSTERQDFENGEKLIFFKKTKDYGKDVIFNQKEEYLIDRLICGYSKSHVCFYNLVINIFHEVTNPLMMHQFMKKRKQLTIYSNNPPYKW